jgi:hypothetical protein
VQGVLSPPLAQQASPQSRVGQALQQGLGPVCQQVNQLELVVLVVVSQVHWVQGLLGLE